MQIESEEYDRRTIATALRPMLRRWFVVLGAAMVTGVTLWLVSGRAIVVLLVLPAVLLSGFQLLFLGAILRDVNSSDAPLSVDVLAAMQRMFARAGAADALAASARLAARASGGN